MSYTYRGGGKDGAGRHQITFKKKIEDYKSEKRCHCGAKLHRFKRDKIRDKERSCYCGAYPFKDGSHRKGTAPWCIHSKRMPTEDEYAERHE